jgi:hypothetical protein
MRNKVAQSQTLQEMIMFTKYTHSRLAVIAALIGANAVSAGNDQPWHYDEDNDTIVYSFVGHPPAPGAPDSNQQTAATRSWHYDEEMDTVVYKFVGQPVSPVVATASQQTAANRPWHYDEETDTVLYNSTNRSVGQAKVFASMTE